LCYYGCHGNKSLLMVNNMEILLEYMDLIHWILIRELGKSSSLRSDDALQLDFVIRSCFHNLSDSGTLVLMPFFMKKGGNSGKLVTLVTYLPLSIKTKP